MVYDPDAGEHTIRRFVRNDNKYEVSGEKREYNDQSKKWNSKDERAIEGLKMTRRYIMRMLRSREVWQRFNEAQAKFFYKMVVFETDWKNGNKFLKTGHCSTDPAEWRNKQAGEKYFDMIMNRYGQKTLH